MDGKNDEFRKRLLSTFKVEAREHVQALSSGLIELEKTPDLDKQQKIVETVFREAHSLKGAARAVNLTDMEMLCQSLESLFAAWKRQELSPSPPLFDTLHDAVDTLEACVVSLEAEHSSDDEKFQLQALLERLESVRQGKLSPSSQAEGSKTERGSPAAPRGDTAPSLAQEKSLLAETVRIPTARLDALLLQAEELIAAKLAALQRTTEIQALNAELATWKKEWTKFRITDFGMRNTKLRNPQSQIHDPQLKEFLEWNENHIEFLEGKLTMLTKSTEEDQRALGRMVDDLLENMKKVVMLPFSLLLEVFPKLVRDLSRDRGKDVDLIIRGGDIEADRRILEEIKDPLIHLVRNGIDHGIEDPTERVRKKKPPHGTITIAIAAKNSNKVEILVADDGAGISAVKVKAAALKLGLVAPDAANALDEREALSLAFQSGVSTSPIITDISGRGLGLAIVREKVEKLGGTVSVETSADAGTSFRMVLPLTLATFHGVLVRVGTHLFVLPTTNVERVTRVKKETIRTVENRETIQLNGHVVSLVRLDDALALSRTTPLLDRAHIVVVGTAEQRVAFLVDEVLSEQEVLVKSLGKQLSRVWNIAGATVLGTGTVVPIVNVPDVLKSAARASAIAVPSVPAQAEGTATQRKAVLVVEDSVTARTLLKNILETAGYNVTTAVDGIDGFTKLRSGQFDIVVSDVDMPRMNGFDLTAKMRSDQQLADIPVVLVTALESREDREHGSEVGANAYIVKSSFDQSNLLDALHRLI